MVSPTKTGLYAAEQTSNLRSSPVRSFELSVKGTSWKRTICALTRGRARYIYWSDLRETWPDIEFKHISCRSLVALPITPDQFLKTASCRGVPFARIGMRVEVEGEPGVIVGSNSSANFDVLFTDGRLKGQELNCHPNWMFKYFDVEGNLIAEFKA